MAQTKKLKPNAADESRPAAESAGEVRVAIAPSHSRRLLLGIIAVASIWLVMMSGSIWFSAVPQAGLKAGILLGVGGLFIGGWSWALVANRLVAGRRRDRSAK